MPLSVTGKGVMCTVYGVWCMQCSVVCLSRHGLVFTVTAFQAISGEESLPGLSAQGARDAETQDASQLLRSSTVTPRMSRKCPKCPSPVAVRSGFRLPQDLQGSIIWWLPSAQFMLYMRENYASRIYDSRELDQRFFLTPLQANTCEHL